MGKKTHPLRPRRHVLLDLHWWDDRLMRGVARYAHEAGWVLDARRRHRRWKESRHRPDGVITLASTSKERIRAFGVPVVAIGSDEADCPRVTAPVASIGTAAAEHFISRGIEHIGFVRYAGRKNGIENRRCEALRQAVLKMGRQFHPLVRRGLQDQLRRVPKPIGLMSQNDDRMIELMEFCLEQGYQIPEQVALLGIDDVESICELALVPLSSINMNFELRGYEAARLLDRLMDGKPPPKKPVFVPIRGVTVRRSTDILAIGNPHVVAAVKFIREHFCEPVKVRDLTKQSHVSRQTLQKLFRRHVGCSMRDMIVRLRVEEAKNLLRKTGLKIDDVAERCGFTDRLHFHRAFHRIVGTPPATWRQQQP